ncbi:MAG: S8 family peptidase [Pseudomonadota bacterium]
MNRATLKRLTTGLLLAVFCVTTPALAQSTSSASTYIVRATSSEQARLEVERVGGEVLGALNVIKAVEARLTSAQANVLADGKQIFVFEDQPVVTQGKNKKKDKDDDKKKKKKKKKGEDKGDDDDDKDDDKDEKKKNKKKSKDDNDRDDDEQDKSDKNSAKDDDERSGAADYTYSSSWSLFDWFGGSDSKSTAAAGDAVAAGGATGDVVADNGTSDEPSTGPAESLIGQPDGTVQDAIDNVQDNIEDAQETVADARDTLADALDGEFLRSTASNGILDGAELSRSMDSTTYLHPALINAPDVHMKGINGAGITVAVIDTGLWWEADTLLSKGAQVRVDFTGQDLDDDPNGHGTHVANIIASDRLASNWVSEGIAPWANLAILRAFDAYGRATYADVIRAIEFAIVNKDNYNIRVLNMSFSAPPQSYYWEDPLNQAVMAAWKAGIVVVASAGNDGPDPMTIGVPGNVPYIITVGAMTDAYTDVDGTDDRLASFSSVGPTYEGFIKPEVVAPGGHIVSTMPFDSYISMNHPDSMLDNERHFQMSGTSQAAAVVSGIVALMLDADPALTPDDVKCRLLASSRPAVDADGTLAYSVFQQGAGLVNALAAVDSSAVGCANEGLNIDADLAGETHFAGPARVDDQGNYYIADNEGEAIDSDGYAWSRSYVWGRGFAFSDSYVWGRGYAWSRAYTWSRSYVWGRSLPWQESTMDVAGDSGDVEAAGVDTASPATVNRWVDHE